MEERIYEAFKREMKKWGKLDGSERIAITVWVTSLPESDPKTKECVKILNEAMKGVKR